MKPKTHANPPAHCDLCTADLDTEFVDCKTVHGPWANLCTKCFHSNGIGLGTGLGQHWVFSHIEFKQDGSVHQRVFTKKGG